MELFPFDRVLLSQAAADVRAAVQLASRNLSPPLRNALLNSRRGLRDAGFLLERRAVASPPSLLKLERALDQACGAYESLHAHVAPVALVPDPGRGLSDLERIRRWEWFRGWFSLAAPQVRVLPWAIQLSLFERISAAVQVDPELANALTVAEGLCVRTTRARALLPPPREGWEARVEPHRSARANLVKLNLVHASLVRAALTELGQHGDEPDFSSEANPDWAVVRWRGDDLCPATLPPPLPGA